MIGRLLTDRRGATSIEYAVIAGVISIVILAGVTSIGTKLDALFLGPVMKGFR